MSITNGTVTVEDGIKAKEEYAPARKVNVTIAFNVTEGQDGEKVANEAGDAANAAVHRLLGTTAPVKVAKPGKPAAAATPASEPAKPALTDKDKLAAAAGLPVDDGLGGASEPAKPAKPEKPAKPAVIEDNLDDLLGPEAPKPITDAELTDAAQKKNKSQKEKDPKWSPVKIRELCVKYAGADKHFRDIPADKRADFLKELEALS